MRGFQVEVSWTTDRGVIGCCPVEGPMILTSSLSPKSEPRTFQPTRGGCPFCPPLQRSCPGAGAAGTSTTVTCPGPAEKEPGTTAAEEIRETLTSSLTLVEMSGAEETPWRPALGRWTWLGERGTSPGMPPGTLSGTKTSLERCQVRAGEAARHPPKTSRWTLEAETAAAWTLQSGRESAARGGRETSWRALAEPGRQTWSRRGRRRSGQTGSGMAPATSLRPAMHAAPDPPTTCGTRPASG